VARVDVSSCGGVS